MEEYYNDISISENSNSRDPDGGSKKKIQFHFIGNKAGMGEIDKEKVAQVVEEASANSEYYKRQLEKRQKYDLKINEMKETINRVRADPFRMQQLQDEIPIILKEAEK